MSQEIPSFQPAPGKNWHAHHVAVSKAALQMVRQALRNDAEAGRAVRAEMLDELDKATFAIPSPEGAQAAVMRQALEALEIIAAQDRSEGFESGRTTTSAITALRAALAAPAPQAPVALTDEQILAALRSTTNEPPVRLPPGWVRFARAIEAAHGITQTKEPTNDR